MLWAHGGGGGLGVGVRGFVRGVEERFAPDSGTSQRGSGTMGFGGSGGGGAMGGTLVIGNFLAKNSHIRTRMRTMISNNDQYNHS